MTEQPSPQRLQKILAQADVGSRRYCEKLIAAGRVRVNGRVAQLGQRADPQEDRITLDGRPIADPAALFYVAVNKAKHVLTTNAAHANDARPTLREMLPFAGHLYTIGRLDATSEGLVVFTNDGPLTQRLTHPRFRHTKTYQIVVNGAPSAEALVEWRNGVWLWEEGQPGKRGRRVKTAPCAVSVLGKPGKRTTLRVVMREGRKRQLRRVAAHLGHTIHRLQRTHIGRLSLGSLQANEYRVLGLPDVAAMQEADPALPP
ncbi:MAG: pseudouridine synthase [Chloroflexi bacterium]|nr:pseudouridine synthase [Chloroflexota bacterium]